MEVLVNVYGYLEVYRRFRFWNIRSKNADLVAPLLGNQCCHGNRFVSHLLGGLPDMLQYRSVCDSFLGGIDIPIDALLCKSHNCVSHVQCLQMYCNDIIVECMRISANIVVPTVTEGVENYGGHLN